MDRRLLVPALMSSLLALALQACSTLVTQDKPYQTKPGRVATPLVGSKQADVRQELPAVLAPVFDKDKKTIVGYEIDVQEMKDPKNVLETGDHNTNPRAMFIGRLGEVDWTTYWFWEFNLPNYLTDADGGTIRLVMQHEIDPLDQLRVIDLHIATEFSDDRFGRRGRSGGRYGWTRQSGGGDYSWILGDGTPHNIATPWGWAWIMDYAWLQGNGVVGGDRIRIYSHPHVTTRVILMD